MSDADLQQVRVDKWLWAARFFKTRSLAKRAIEGGKVRILGNHIKASKEIQTGVILELRQGWDTRHIIVKALSEKRGAASIAQTLYEETAESIAKREQAALERKLAGASTPRPDSKPNTKQRRHIHRFKRDILQP